MSSETARAVTILLSEDVAASLPAAARTEHVWAVRSPATEALAQEFWRQHSRPTASGPGGVTLFTGGSTPEDSLLSVIDMIELHHGIAASERPAVTILRVLGAVPSRAVKDALERLGFGQIETQSGGFVAHWHRA